MAEPNEPDRLDQLYAIADRYARRYPAEQTASGCLTRLVEELGEIALEIQRLEGIPGKVSKHGPGTLDDLASEIEDLIHTALGLRSAYAAAPALDRVLKREFAKVRRDQT